MPATTFTPSARAITTSRKAFSFWRFFLAPFFTLMFLSAFNLSVQAQVTVGDFRVTGGTQGTDWRYAANVLTILRDGIYTVAMRPPVTTTLIDRIVVASGVTADITLNGVSINLDARTGDTDDNAAFLMERRATVNLTLVGANLLRSGANRAGLQVPSDGAKLTIGGTGTLEATATQGGGAGIGGNNSDTGGVITINSGIVRATGSGRGAGIGDGGGKKSCAERALLEYFGKDRLMVGATANGGQTFFSYPQNREVIDVEYLYLSRGLPVQNSSCYNACPSPNCNITVDNRSVACTPDGNNWVNCEWWACWNQTSGQENQNPGRYLRDFLNRVEGNGHIPMASYYVFAEAFGGEANLSHVNNVTSLARYFNDFRFMLQQIGNRKVILHIEPDLWGYAQQAVNSASPRNIPAVVSQANPTDCGTGFENNFAGFSRCLIHMVRTYAPRARVGLQASAWAVPSSDVNINVLPPGMTVKQHAEEVIRYMKLLGTDETDFLVIEAIDRDADCYQTTICHTQINPARWWDNTNQTLPNFNQHFEWARALREAVGKPLVWWQLPLGNRNSPNQAVPDNLSQQYQTMFNQTPPAYLNYGYRDNRVDYLLTHMDDIVSAGGVLAAFGAGSGTQTNPLTDGGNFARLVREYKQQSSAGYGYCGGTASGQSGVAPAPF